VHLGAPSVLRFPSIPSGFSTMLRYAACAQVLLRMCSPSDPPQVHFRTCLKTYYCSGSRPFPQVLEVHSGAPPVLRFICSCAHPLVPSGFVAQIWSFKKASIVWLKVLLSAMYLKLKNFMLGILDWSIQGSRGFTQINGLILASKVPL
jgi:hypothetical protein